MCNVKNSKSKNREKTWKMKLSSENWKITYSKIIRPLSIKNNAMYVKVICLKKKRFVVRNVSKIFIKNVYIFKIFKLKTENKSKSFVTIAA